MTIIHYHINSDLSTITFRHSWELTIDKTLIKLPENELYVNKTKKNLLNKHELPSFIQKNLKKFLKIKKLTPKKLF